MRRGISLFFISVLLFVFFVPGLAENKPSYTISYYFNSNYNYPGEKIPVNVYLYYYYLDRKGDFTEKVSVKLYKVPQDLSGTTVEEWIKQNEPVEELNKKITMKTYSSDYWDGYENVELPALESGCYYLLCSSPHAKYGSTFRVSKIAMSVKASRDRLILYSQDYKSGNPVEGFDIKVYSGKETKTYKTDKTGILKIYLQDLKEAKPGNSIRIVGQKGSDSAEVNVTIPVEQELLKGYIYTDRPVYRPDQKVNFKGILRKEKGDRLDYVSGEEIEVKIIAQSAEIYKKTLKTDDYGNISGEFTLAKEPALGTYYINCTGNNSQLPNGYFQVEEYRKPEFEIKVSPGKEQYVQGEKMTFNMDVKYYFGSPVPDTDYSYEIYRSYYYPWHWYYWWEEDSAINPYSNYGGEFISSGKGKTDKNGKGSFTCDASKVDYDANYTVTVRMADESRREVTGGTTLLITRGAYYISITPEKYFYRPGEKAHLKVEAKDYKDKPVSASLTLTGRYEKYNESDKKWEWKDVKTAEIKTDSNGLCYYDVLLDKEGYYEFTCKGLDQNRNEIKSTGYIYCYGGGYYNWYRFSNLEIIPDKNYYSEGDTASFMIVSPFEGVKGLVTVEGEKVFSEELMDFSNKTGSLNVKITPDFSPNFYVTVSFYYEGNFYYQSKKIVCPSKDKFLTVSIESDKEKYKPRDTAKFTLKTVDSSGKPVTGQLCMGIADESVYAVVSETTPNIQRFFYGSRENRIYTYGSDGSVYGGPYYYGYKERDGLCKSKSLDESSISNLEMSDKKTAGRAEGGKDGGGAPMVQPDFTRSYFPDTAYFNPGIITDQNGVAEVLVSMPDTLTTWRSTVRAVSKDTKVGETTKKVIVTKDLLARLIMPRFFTERDECVITGIVHNYLNSEKTVQAKLEIDGDIEILDSPELKVKIPANGSKPVNWKVKVKRAGESTVKLTALTDEESDAVELKVPVLPHGTEKFTAAGGSTKDKAEETLVLPKEADRGSAKCVIILEPSLASTVLSSLDYLVGYPYGCVEQTMSRFLPNVIVSKTLGELDIYNEKINKDLPDMVKKGFERLYNFHHSDGGWGWWENDESHPYMTAYVVYGLSLAKEAGYKIDENKLKAGIGWLREHYGKEKDINTRAYMAFAMTTAGENCKDLLLKLYESREKLDSYGKAVLTISLGKCGLTKEAKYVAELLEKTADVSGTVACWSGMTGSHGWTDNQVETTSYCLSALLKVKPESVLIPKVVRYLSTSRNGNYWYSTKDSAAAVMALTGYIKESREMNPDFTADVYFNGTKLDTVKFTKDDVGKPGKEIDIPFDKGLLQGENKVRFEMNGKGVLYYAAYLRYYTGEENVKPASSGFKVTRSYYLLKPGMKDIEKERIKLGSNGNISVNSQDIIQVELNITGSSNYEYIIIEDPKPAGCEFDEKQRENASEWNYWYAHKELRDEKIAYFCTYYSSGSRKVTYRLRAETPGTFHVMPCRAYAMYTKEIGGNSDEMVIKITEQEKVEKTPVSVEPTAIPVSVQTPGSTDKKLIYTGAGVIVTAGLALLLFLRNAKTLAK